MIEFFHLVERVSNTELWWNWHEINRFIGLFSMKFIDGRSPRRTLAFCKLCWSTDGNVPHEQDSRTVCSPDPGLKLRLGQWLLGWVFETQERKKTQCYACSRINFWTTFFSYSLCFPHQEPWVRGPPSKHLVQIVRGGSSYSRFLMREHSK